MQPLLDDTRIAGWQPERKPLSLPVLDTMRPLSASLPPPARTSWRGNSALLGGEAEANATVLDAKRDSQSLIAEERTHNPLLFCSPLKPFAQPLRYSLGMSLLTRWLNAVDVTLDDNECWLSTKRLNNCGYPLVDDDTGKSITTAKAALLLFRGPPPFAGAETLHRCPDGPNRRCANPNHLEWGSAADNAQDKVRAGNLYTQKLNPDDVRDIRRWLARGSAQKDIAALYGVSPNQVGRIARGEQWGWLD